MAQALFDEHPLEEYLRESGESSMLIPGISSELEQEIDPNYGMFEDATLDEGQLDWCPHALLELLQSIQATVSLAKSKTSTTSSFTERFKYNVISSSLLELSLPTPHPQRTHRSLRIPGNLQHSRTSSIDIDNPPPPPSVSPESVSPEQPYGSISIAALLAALFFGGGYPFLAFLSVVAALFLLYNVTFMNETPKYDITLSLNALDDLVAANDTWDSVIQDAMVFLDKEDQNIHSSTGPLSPSPIRVALHSCLQTTHTQCDSIRHLFSALTSPTNLSQLTEMYAPPSPVNVTTFASEARSRPLSIQSLPMTSLSSSTPTTPQNKRSTWTGSYSSLAYSGSPMTPVMRRKDRRKTVLSDVFHVGTSSAPTSPLVNVSDPEPQDAPMAHSSGEGHFSSLPAHFGAAALDLQRNRRSGGMEAFRMPPASYFTSDLRSPRSARNSMFPASSKFTTASPSRNPLSYSSLNHSLQSTLAAKRHACSHLLALRFGDEEDDGYWEDVRSVMGLLGSALTDGYSRLTEALTEVEQQKLRDQNPTPVSSQSPCSEIDIDVVGVPENDTANSLFGGKWPKSANSVSFAPMPNNLSRFGAHVAAISAALDDARDHLEECVAALKADSASPANASPSKRSLHSRSMSGILPSATEETVEESQALQAYERLRRELGLALRECERGRGRLLDIINPPAIPSDDDEEFDDLPGLGHDASDDSDKADPTSPYDDEAEAAALAAAGRFRPTVVNNETGDGDGQLMDDATSHLLLATSTQHLPLPGIEEVFEADTGAKAVFTREKSKLSREERIKIAKARRESGMGLAVGLGAGDGAPDSDGAVRMGMERWGPGGEVVQELKDVIWKVGERRRMMAAVNTAAQLELPRELPSEPTQLVTIESS